MAMLVQQTTYDQTQTTLGTFDYEICNSAPSEAAGTVGASTTPYTRWVAKNHTPGSALKGNKYNVGKMNKFRKILKYYSKQGTTAMSA